MLDESVEHAGNSELAHSTPTLGDLLPSHWLRLVRASEQRRSYRRAMFHHVCRQLIHGHPIDPGTALVLLHSLQRRLDVAARDHLRHQAVDS